MKKVILSIVSFLLLAFMNVAFASGLSYSEKKYYNNTLDKVYIKLEIKYDNNYDSLIDKLNTIIYKIEKIRNSKYNKLNDKSKDLINLIDNSLKYKVKYYKNKKNEKINLNFGDIFGEDIKDNTGFIKKIGGENMRCIKGKNTNISLCSGGLILLKIDGNFNNYYYDVFLDGKNIAIFVDSYDFYATKLDDGDSYLKLRPFSEIDSNNNRIYKSGKHTVLIKKYMTGVQKDSAIVGTFKDTFYFDYEKYSK